MLWAMVAAAPQPQHWKLTCGAAAHHGLQSLQGTRYGPGQPFGFDLADAPPVRDGACTSGSAFFVSASEPDGDYRVTVILGDKAASSVTTVKAEARRLMLWDVATEPGKTARRSFVVHVRTPEVNEQEQVRLKSREIGNLDW